MLSCSCENDDAEWWYNDTKDVAPLATKRMRKCCSCKTRIAVGDDCKPFPRWRNVSEYSDPEVVVRIYGEGGEMPLPTWYLCDRCAGLYESLDSLGFCGMLGDNLVQTCREYGQMQRDAGVFRGQMVMAPNVELSGLQRPKRKDEECHQAPTGGRNAAGPTKGSPKQWPSSGDEAQTEARHKP